MKLGAGVESSGVLIFEFQGKLVIVESSVAVGAVFRLFSNQIF